MWRVYLLKNCDSCRRATNYLRDRGVEFETIPIRETPPTRAELTRVLASEGGEVRRLFNVSGREYRLLGIGERLPGLSADEAIDLLAGNGSLIKRPVVVGEKWGLVGFDEARWGREFPEAD